MKVKYIALYLSFALVAAVYPLLAASEITPPAPTENEEALSQSKSLVEEKDWLSDFDTRLVLAQVLSYQKGRAKEALEEYLILLKEKPLDLKLIFETGKIYAQLKEHQKALTLFHQVLEQEPRNPKVLLAIAQVEGALGHAQRSYQFTQRIFAAYFPKILPFKLLIGCADLTMMWGDFYQAEILFRLALEKKPQSLNLWLKLGWVLVSSQRYEEAILLYLHLLEKHPDHPKILEALVSVNLMAKKFPQAQAYVQQLSAARKKPLLEAEVLYLSGDYDGALESYERVDTIKGYLGKGKSLKKLNRPEEAQEAFISALELDPTNIPARFYLAELKGIEGCIIYDAFDLSIEELAEWGALYSENAHTEAAAYIFSLILDKDPEYFPAQISLAESLSGLFEYPPAKFIYQSQLDIFPWNTKLLMAIARVESWSKNYKTSLLYYDELIALNPDDPIPLLEEARVAIWGYMYKRSMDNYDLLLSDKFADVPALQYAVSLEKEEKRLVWNKRCRTAIPVFEILKEMAPGNEEALFDYAQDACSIGRYDLAYQTYKGILQINQNHNLVRLASERNLLQLHPKVMGAFSYWRELGSGTFSQSQIARYQASICIEQPLNFLSKVRFFQHQWVENPFYNYKFYPAEGQTIEGECQFNNYTNANAGATYKNYFGQFKSQFTGHFQLNTFVNDDFRMTFGVQRENEVSNFFSLKQATQYVASTISIYSDWTKYWNVAGTYRHLSFTDSNWRQEANLTTEYAFTDTPNVFKLILSANYLNTKHESIPIFVGPKLVDVIFPYWTPKHYFSGYVTLEWRHDYRFFEFCEAPQRYVDLKITGGEDTVDNPSIQVILEWKHEFEEHWGIELKGLIHRSKQWNAEGAWASVCYTF